MRTEHYPGDTLDWSEPRADEVIELAWFSMAILRQAQVRLFPRPSGLSIWLGRVE